MFEEERQPVPPRQCVIGSLAGGAFGQHLVLQRKDSCLQLLKDRRRLCLTQLIALSMVHVLLKGLSVDGEKLVVQPDDTRRIGIFRINLHCVNKKSSRMGITKSMNHRRSPGMV